MLHDLCTLDHILLYSNTTDRSEACILITVHSLTISVNQPVGEASLHLLAKRLCTFSSSFLPARRYASAGNSDRNVSVCPSVTRRYGVKTKKGSGMISSPSDSPKTLVFWCQISSPNSKGFPPNGGLKQGSVGKIQRFSSFNRQYLENGSRYGQSYY